MYPANKIEIPIPFRLIQKMNTLSHSAVESSTNALENHGLDRCKDHGLHGFKRYVGLAVVARNMQIIGHIIRQRELARLQRIENKLCNKSCMAL